MGPMQTLKKQWDSHIMRLSAEQHFPRWFSIMWSADFYRLCNMNPSMQQAINLALMMLIEEETFERNSL